MKIVNAIEWTDKAETTLSARDVSCYVWQAGELVEAFSDKFWLNLEGTVRDEHKRG